MGMSWEDLLNEFVRVRDADYRNDVDRQLAMSEMTQFVIQTMLEMLRDGRGE